MIKVKQILLGLGLIFVQTPELPAQSSVTPQITYEYYPVQSEKARDLIKTAFEVSPISNKNNKYLGLTNAQINYKYNLTHPLIEICRYENIEVTCQCKITLPELQTDNMELKQNFAAYLEKLKAHELEHCRIATAHASEFLSESLKLGDQKCTQQKQVMADLFTQINDRLKAAQKRYDHRTRHGHYEGADLKGHLYQ